MATSWGKCFSKVANESVNKQVSFVASSRREREHTFDNVDVVTLLSSFAFRPPLRSQSIDRFTHTTRDLDDILIHSIATVHDDIADRGVLGRLQSELT